MLATLVIPESIIEDVAAEVQRARTKFPRNVNLNIALSEEFGEFAAAQLQGRKGDTYKEGIQVIGLVVRILTEGDASIVMDDESMQK